MMNTIGELVVVDSSTNALEDGFNDGPGPVDPSVLYDQDEHVSSAVWEGLERGALRCHEHTSKLDEWKLTAKQMELVEKAGFKHFMKIGAFSLDNQLISALVERWRKETNTFHLPVGEMTITLDEVALILGLAIDGEAVTRATVKDSSSGFTCERLLGKTPSSNDRRGGSVKLSWLKETFSQCSENSPVEEVEQSTRAYLLYLIGSTMFSTTGGNTVPVMYLSLFEDFDRAGKYAWGAAALAFLYRALGNATTKSQSTISGCLTLLQCWSYSHLNIGRPKLCQVSTNGTFPLALRWKQKQTGQRVKCNLVQYRKVLDSLQPHDVDWLPYKNVNRTIPEGIKLMLILGRSKTTLLCFDKSEKHNPDRCLRQFGIRQPIPQAVRVDTEVDTIESPDSSCSEWMKRQDNIVKGGEGADCNEYYQWYSKITRRYVGRHTSLESVFRQTVAGMTKMLELANTLSRDDMTSKNKEIIANIRSTLTKSLKNPIACSEDIFPARSAKKRKQKDT